MIGIDGMFFLSAFRLYLSVFDSFKRQKRNFLRTLLNWPINYFPGYLAYIVLLVLLPRLIVGPYADLTENFIENCKHNWFKPFVFISNEDHQVDQCITVSWFNSLNFQLSLLHYLLVFVFIQSEKLGLGTACLQIGAVTVFEIYRMFSQNLSPYHTVISNDM